MAAPSALVVSGVVNPQGQMLSTPEGHADISITVITPLVAILIRAAKSYLQMLVGLLGTAGFGLATQVLPSGDFMHTLKVCAGLSISAGVMSLLTNLVAFLTSLGDQFPILKT